MLYLDRMSFDPKRPPGSKPPAASPSTRPTPTPGIGTRTTVPSTLKPPSSIRDAVREAQAIAGGATLSRPSTAPTSVRPGRKTILVVDNDAGMRAALKAALIIHYDVVEANDGMEAVDIIGNMPPPAMVVCDVQMPRVDGFTLAKIMRGNPLMKKIPIMFVSARNSPQDVTQALVLGACQYLPKTTPIPQIVEKISKIVV